MRILAPGLVLLALTAALPAMAESGAEPESGFREGISLLHEGRFDEAEESFGVAHGRPEASAFFRAFAVYWRLLYDPGETRLETSLEERLLKTTALAEETLHHDAADPEATLYAGTAHLLLAELRAKQKKIFAAVSEAKKAKRLLEAGSRSGSIATDSSFGLGTYNYMADKAPAFVKGLRAFLFLPGGDRDTGLAQLARAAQGSRYFRLEARILLSTIYASKQERLYSEADREARAALDGGTRSVASLHAAARFKLMMAEPERAAELLDEAARRAAAAPRTHPTVSAALEYQRARADFAMLRPDLAHRRLSALLAKHGLPKDLEQDARRLSETSASLLAAPPAEGPWDRALPGIVELAERAPGDPILSLLAGRALLRAGRGNEAFPLLASAARSSGTPRPLTGMSKLLAGQAADLAGRRADALELYRAAIDAPSFVGREAAYHYQRAPFRGQA